MTFDNKLECQKHELKCYTRQDVADKYLRMFKTLIRVIEADDFGIILHYDHNKTLTLYFNDFNSNRRIIR